MSFLPLSCEHLKIYGYTLVVKCQFYKHKTSKKEKDNIKEWTGMDFASSTRAAENRSRWKGIVANSSVVPR